MSLSNQYNDTGVWDGRHISNTNQIDQTAFHNRPYGRRCRIVCDNDIPHHPDLRYIARQIIGKTLQQALAIYPNIRVIIRDGVPQIVTQDYRPDRINVETRNNIIIRVIKFG